MNPTARFLSYSLLFGGVITAAIASAKIPSSGQTFANTWPITILALVVAVVGVCFWRWALSRERKSPTHASEQPLDPFVLLTAFGQPLNKLKDQAGKITTQEITAQVDRLQTNYLIPFSLVRHQVIDRLGMREGAEILVDLAVVERMLNRAWSAAADECGPESIAAIDEAATVYGQIQQRLTIDTK
ncbi:MAG: hypothetical protein GY768_09805 [Planctomycetaceae bacterium]|nr:hypothetical protein [Planctomycetaceae bacterium]